MTSRERVLAVFDRQIPDRVPMWCGASPEFMAKSRAFLNVKTDEEVLVRFHDDFRRVFSRYAGPPLPEGVSLFGVERHGIGYGQPVSHPLENATLEEIDAYAWPDPDWIDVSHIRADAESWHGEYAILGGEWCPFFHDAIDIFFLGNDFGSQTGPLMGKALFDEFMIPHIRRLCAQAHSYGKRTMMHCCGSFYPLMSSLSDAGVDALQSLQPITPEMQPKHLKETLGGQMIFNGCVNSIDTLIQGTPQETKRSVREILATMMPGGGYILSASHDYLLEETPVENVLAMFDTGLALGRYE